MSGSSGGISDTASTHIGSLRTESTDVDSGKASPVNVNALTVQPVVTRFTRQVSGIRELGSYGSNHH
jgi:hypothetical protein